MRHPPVTSAPPIQSEPASSETVPDLAVPAWREIANPEHIYVLDAPELGEAPITYAASRSESGGREDSLTRGAFDGTKPAIRLRMVRSSDEPSSETSLFVALVHEAAAAGFSIARSGVTGVLPTRFGTFEVADLSLTRPGASAPLPCSGFRIGRQTPALSITGLACGRQTEPLSRNALGCLVEHLDLAAVGNDRALADFFASAAPTAACGERPRVEAALHADPPSDDRRAGRPATGRRSLRRR